MTKLLFLEHIYDLSDEKVIERGNFDLAFLWFLGLNPEEHLPDPSLLAKFRTQRLQEATLDDILTEIIRQCVEKGIIKGKALTVDTTHILANTTKKVPERVMKHLAKKIFKGLQEDIGFIPEDIPTELPNYKEIEDHREAKETMKAALETVMEAAAPYAGEETEAAIAEAKEILSDEKFLLQKGVRSLSDKDARVGNKSKTDQFFGYKAEYTKKYKKRAAQEWKNGEMKRFHGMNRARGWGKRSVSFQAKFTAIAVNLKRIAALWREGELRADAKAAIKPKRFPQAEPPDGCRGFLAPIDRKNRENTALFWPLFPLFSAIFA
jgi:IS5 family transposase